MKLHVVVNKKSGNVVGHTRDKEVFEKYTDALNMDKHTTFILNSGQYEGKVKKDVKASIKELESQHPEKVLSFMTNLEDEVVPESDKDIFSFADEEYAKLKMLQKDLKNVVKNYSLHKDDKKILSKSLDVIDELLKKKNFEKAVGLDTIREVVKNSPLINIKKMFDIGGNK